MKKLALTAVLFAIVVVLGVLAINHYKNYQNQKQAQATPMISVKESDQRVEDAKAAAIVGYTSNASFNQAVAECQKGSIAYGRLTTAIKNQTAAPVCPAPKI
jgi:predicted negative regulator of RcsB-dependent stress response